MIFFRLLLSLGLHPKITHATSVSLVAVSEVLSGGGVCEKGVISLPVQQLLAPLGSLSAPSAKQSSLPPLHLTSSQQRDFPISLFERNFDPNRKDNKAFFTFL